MSRSGERSVLVDLATVATELERDQARANEATALRRVQYNLMRMWVDV